MTLFPLFRSFIMNTQTIRAVTVILVVYLAVSMGTVAQSQAAQAKVSTGVGHGALLKADGTVWTWGSSGSGQLSNGSDSWASEPEAVPGMASIKDAACGGNFTLAVKDDGTVWAWGANDYGQLGNGSTEPSNRPVQIPDLTGVNAVAASGNHAMALKSDGTVWEWGRNYSKGSRPKQAVQLTDVVAIASGYGTQSGHSVALKSDGTVWDWGPGALGGPCGQDANVPVRAGELPNGTAVASAYKLTLVLKQDGTVWMMGEIWGLGDRNQPDKLVMVRGLNNIKAVAAGNNHVVAMKGDGTVWSFGSNHYGQLGTIKVKADKSGKSIVVDESADPVRAGTLSDVVAVAAGGDHSVALTKNGTVLGWGDNLYGALGTDTEDLGNSEVPMKIGQPMPGECNWPLFGCDTFSGKGIQICGEQDGDKFTKIQYRFGPAHGPPELLYPKEPSQGEPPLFFSHEWVGGEYRVSVRFSTGGYTFKVYSNNSKKDGAAGVKVINSKGKLVSDISCLGAPAIYIDYLRESLPCDMQNPHGAAACKEAPYRTK